MIMHLELQRLMVLLNSDVFGIACFTLWTASCRKTRLDIRPVIFNSTVVLALAEMIACR